MLNASAPDAGPTMSADKTAPADFRPTTSRANLALRAQLLRRMRQFFDGRGFLEVETPLLSADTVVDRHLDPLPVTLFDDPREPAVGRTLWLQTSPEYGMKRLLPPCIKWLACFVAANAARGTIPSLRWSNGIAWAMECRKGCNCCRS